MKQRGVSKRRGTWTLGIAAACILASCNAILGNEDHYRLAADDCTSSTCGGGDGTSGASNAGQSGRGGASGGRSGMTGGRGGASGATGTSGDGAVAAGTDSGGDGSTDGGAAGTTGGPCTPTGREQCLNGIDDDCNGDTDCADAACAGPVSCVPATGDAMPSTFVGMGQTCPTGYSPVTLRRGLAAPADCTGCTCVSPQTICVSGLYAHGTFPCGTSQYTGPLSNVFTGRCDPMPNDNDLYYFDITSFTECTTQGTATPVVATWGETRTLCVADNVGGGCPSGQRCAPTHTTPSCTVTSSNATCGAATPDNTGGRWYTGLSDTRMCGACDCPFNYGSGSCGNAYIQGFSLANCQGTSVAIGNGTPGSACGLAFAPVSGRVVATPTGGSCQPRAFGSGAATETGPRTVCCE